MIRYSSATLQVTPATWTIRNYRFVKLPDEFVMFFERDRVWRDIWTDGRKLPGPEAKPRWYGYATAHWDGDTLVVESSGYDERSLDRSLRLHPQ